MPTARLAAPSDSVWLVASPISTLHSRFRVWSRSPLPRRHTHADLAIAAARAGKHVICEKPFAMDTAEAEAMLDAAESAGVTHLVGHEFRWAVERAVAGRAIHDGLLGEPRVATFVSYVPLVA